MSATEKQARLARVIAHCTAARDELAPLATTPEGRDIERARAALAEACRAFTRLAVAA